MSGKHELPLGWESRNNTMSEHDIKLGGDAANKFSNKGAYAAGNGTSEGYKTSDEIRDFYFKKIENTISDDSHDNKNKNDALPSGWEGRQKLREIESKYYISNATDPSNKQIKQQRPLDKTSIETKFVKVATVTLNELAEALEDNPTAILSEKNRGEFASAMRRALNAISQCR